MLALMWPYWGEQYRQCSCWLLDSSWFTDELIPLPSLSSCAAFMWTDYCTTQVPKVKCLLEWCGWLEWHWRAVRFPAFMWRDYPSTQASWSQVPAGDNHKWCGWLEQLIGVNYFRVHLIWSQREHFHGNAIWNRLSSQPHWHEVKQQFS